jgi:hypothetical protein
MLHSSEPQPDLTAFSSRLFPVSKRCRCADVERVNAYSIMIYEEAQMHSKVPIHPRCPPEIHAKLSLKMIVYNFMHGAISGIAYEWWPLHALP